MAKENITVLMDLLQRLEQDRQLLESPVDLNTLKLCTHELETYREQLSKDNRSTVRYDRIEKFLDFMRNNQLLNAKDISGQALSDYQDIQTMSFERNPLFEVNYMQVPLTFKTYYCIKRMIPVRYKHVSISSTRAYLVNNVR